tara:strand:- start:68 stop:289 length:222 start_codon:yes stop_codon:yes gene_type:complete
MKIYEVGVFNTIVRETLRAGKEMSKFSNISPDWENVIYFERVADSEKHLREKVNSEYPASRGFVIEYVNKVSG